MEEVSALIFKTIIKPFCLYENAGADCAFALSMQK